MLGATGLESDAWVTADGVAVLDHDGVVARHGACGAGRSPDSSRATRSPPTSRRCADALRARPVLPSVELSLDVKDPTVVADRCSRRRPPDLNDHLWLCSPAQLAEVGLVAQRPSDEPSGWCTPRRAAGASVPIPPPTRGAGWPTPCISALNLRAGEWSPGRSSTPCHAAGVRAFGMGRADAREADRGAGRDLGVDGVYSDHVEMMVAVLARLEQPECC